MKRTILNTVIRVSTDGKIFSDRMDTITFIERYRDSNAIKAVEICEVVTKSEAVRIINSL